MIHRNQTSLCTLRAARLICYFHSPGGGT